MSIKERFEKMENLYHFTSFDTALKKVESNRIRFGRLNNIIRKIIIFILFVLIPYSVIGEVIVPMERQENGLYLIPCTVNGVPMKFIFDTGASSVNISMTEALFLLKNGHIQETDIKGTSHAQIANGEIVENTRILLHKIEIGGIEINDVDATVSHNLNAPLLLGQSAISKLGAIQLDGSNLIINEHKVIEKENGDNLFLLGLILLIIAVVAYLTYGAFSIFKKRHDIHKTDALGSSSSEKNIHKRICSKLAWFVSRKYLIYLTYCFMLLLSVLVIELYIKDKRDKLYSELIGKVDYSFGGIGQNIKALDFNRIGELEFEEVSIPELFKYDKDKRIDKWKRKHWNNMFSGIEHVYKITDQGWQMAGMQYDLIPNYDRSPIVGIQDYFIIPYMICVPEGLDFNKEIAINIIEESLNRVYCKPDRYNEAAKIKSSENEYFHFVGYTFLQDSLPEIYMHFYDEITGTDPIYDNNKFTGYYWFGLERIGGYRVISAYTNAFAWTIEEKENAVIKNRVSCYSVILILLTICLILFLYFVKHSNRNKT